MMEAIKFRAWDDGGKYLAGSDGLIYSTDFNHTGKTKDLKGYYDRDGYHMVLLNIGGKRVYRASHRLIALAFHGQKPTPKHQVNHKNGIRNDNRPENLEYMTSRENTLHGYRVNGRKHTPEQIADMKARSLGVNNPKAKITPQIALELRQLRECGNSLQTLSDYFELSVSQVGAVCQGRFWNA